MRERDVFMMIIGMDIGLVVAFFVSIIGITIGVGRVIKKKYEK